MIAQHLPRPLRRFTGPELLLFVLVLVALATRLPFLTHGIDEFDSANFAASLINFNIHMGEPHPPGQFYFVLLGRALNFFVRDELTTLSLLSALCSSLTLVPLFYVLRMVYGGNGRLALAAAALTAFTYGYWLTGLRPISDPAGCFFVFATLCALFYGIDEPRWFCAGMALFAVTLGVKQLTLYFLGPVVIIINLVALLKFGLRPVLAGAALFAVLTLGWLIPSVRVCDSWRDYVLSCRSEQQWGYLYESLITHRTWDRLVLQVQHNLRQPWGSTEVAAMILILSAIGVVNALRLGQKAVLFVIFGVGTVLYIFLVMYVFGKYDMYLVPIYCAFAVLGLHALSLRLAACGDPAVFATTGAVLLIGCGLGATFPLLERLRGFRTPMEAIAEQVVALSRSEGNVGVVTDNAIVSNALKYYVHKGKFAYPEGYTYPEIAHLLSSKRQLFLISSQRGNGLDPDLIPISHYHWDGSLFTILEGRDAMRDLYLYQIKGSLFPAFDFTGQHRIPQPFVDGIDGDGWATGHVAMLMPVDAAPVPILHMEGFAPDVPGLSYPYHVRYQIEDRPAAEFSVNEAGPFEVNVPLAGANGPRELSIEMWLPQSFEPAKVVPGSLDTRNMTLEFTHLLMSSAARPLFTRLGRGWYAREARGADWWYWSQMEGTVQVAAERPGTLVITGQMDTFTPGNSIDVLLDGAVAATVTDPTVEWTPQSLRIPMPAGLHTVAFRSRQPGVQPPHDGRTVALGIKDLSFELE